MKKIIIPAILCFFGFHAIVQAQTGFGVSSDNYNVNNPSYADEARRTVINATVELILTKKDGTGTLCTGTLINRNTSDNDVGYYLLTARHCLFADNGTGSYEFDPDREHAVIFNFQSPTGENDDTFLSNRGIRRAQSNGNDVLNGYEYLHRTRMRLVDAFFWGDFALMEILTPVPPHYNFSYAGWNSSKFGTSSLPSSLPAPFINIHHPKGDIKKVNGTNQIMWAESPIATGCYVITTIIDVLFGWIWGHSVSTSVICNYIDNPWIIVPSYTYGSFNNGSSGSALFDPENRILGVLSGPANSYGKLHANYFNASIKNVLNPSNNLWVDLGGLGDRKITEYDNLILPGGNGDGFYFPANHYQPENKIVLKARGNIETSRPITVFNGADYEFVAGNNILLRNGFVVQSGASFSAKIKTVQNAPKQEEMLQEERLIEKLNQIQIPTTIKQRKENFSYDDSFYLRLFINPTNGILQIDSKSENQLQVVGVYNSIGQKMLLYDNLNVSKTEIDLSALPSGMYIVTMNIGDRIYSDKIILRK